MELSVLKPNNPILRQVATAVEQRELRTIAMQDAIEELLEFVYGHNNKGEERQHRQPMTVGLSAPQVGLARRISIVDMAIGSKRYHDIRVLVNPQIVAHSRAHAAHREGCVNLPGVWGEIERYKQVTVEALDRSGNHLSIEARGWSAVLLQHEIDHLDGVLFIDHLDDPTKAHHAGPEQLPAYNKKTATTWPHHIDISELVRPV